MELLARCRALQLQRALHDAVRAMFYMAGFSVLHLHLCTVMHTHTHTQAHNTHTHTHTRLQRTLMQTAGCASFSGGQWQDTFQVEHFFCMQATHLKTGGNVGTHACKHANSATRGHACMYPNIIVNRNWQKRLSKIQIQSLGWMAQPGTCKGTSNCHTMARAYVNRREYNCSDPHGSGVVIQPKAAKQRYRSNWHSFTFVIYQPCIKF